MNGNIYSTIIGTIASDPEPYYKIHGDTEPIGCSFRVAINRCHKEDNQWKTTTQFIEITVRGRRCKDYIESRWCKKGYHVYLSCEQTERTYTTRDGSLRHAPVYYLQDAHPILVSANYAAQKTLQARQEHTQNNLTAHTAVNAPAYKTPPPTPPAEEEADIPF